VRGGLEEVVAAAKGRVVVTTFASNAARLHTIGRVARATAASCASPAARWTAS
jgi:ribonuclease J